MLHRMTWIAVVVFAWAAGAAQGQSSSSFLAGGWQSCEELIQACKDSTPEDVYGGAYMTGPLQSVVGTCYVHDRASCPNCFCWDYVKVATRGGQNGYDGGTGCIGYPNIPSEQESRRLAGEKLKQLCESGQCCCPQNLVPIPCPQGGGPVKARDPITGSCCTFPNVCMVPAGWEQPIGSGDRRCG